MTGDLNLKGDLDDLEKENRRAVREDLLNTAAMTAFAGGLAWWAYGTIPHALLFGFVVFSACAAANRVCSDLRRRWAREDRRYLT